MIIDAVVHAYNFRDDNLIYPPYSQRFSEGTYAHHRMWSPEGSEYVLDRHEFVVDFDEEDTADAVFSESPVDMAVYHATPIYDFFGDGMVSIEKGVRLKARHPGRVLLYGAVSLLDRDSALRQLEQLVGDHAIDGVKFYPAVFVEGRTVHTSLADEDVAFPVLRRAVELGIRNVAVHKSMPLGPTATAPYRVDDVAGAAAMFPEVNFQIVHAGVAFTEETALLLGRLPNVYANLEGTFGYLARRPRTFYEAIGLMAEWSGGYQQLIFASGCNVAHPAPLIESFQAGQMPEDLVSERGYPALDEAAKAAVLGGNFARIHDLGDRVVPDDEFTVRGAAAPRPWSRLRERAGARV
jgi:hypothetical protein